MARKLGIGSKLYNNTGTYGSPTWVEVTIVGDLKVDAKWKTATGATRDTVVEGETRTTLPPKVSGQMKVVDADTNYTTFDNAFYSTSTLLDVLVLNGASTANGATGWRFDAELVEWSEDQGLQKALFKDFELVPSLFYTNKPKRVVVTTGAPVFSDPS